jgi:hypothetical protein
MIEVNGNELNTCFEATKLLNIFFEKIGFKGDYAACDCEGFSLMSDALKKVCEELNEFEEIDFQQEKQNER